MISIFETLANLQTSGIEIPRNPGQLIGIRRLAKIRQNRDKGRLSSTAAKLAGMKGNLGPKESHLDFRKKEVDLRAIKTVSPKV